MRLTSSPRCFSLALLALAAHAAMAQSVTGATASPEPAEPQTILVTAQRRSERILDVPITMSAFSAEALDERGVLKLEDVSASMANVSMFKMASGQPTWIIRGVGLADFSPNNTPTAAVFVDDVYLTSTVMSQIAMFDVERVEVLKGPQGGIYGRNASGGAVKLISARPAFGAAENSVSMGLDNWQRVRAGGAYSATVRPDTWATRIAFNAATGNRSDGGPYELIDHGRHYGTPDSLALRVSNLLKLSAENSLTFIVDAARDKSDTPRLTATGVYAQPGAGPARRLCAPILAGQLDNSTCYSNAQWHQEHYAGNTDQSPGRATPGRSSLSEPFGQFDIDTVGATLQGRFRAAGLDLVSVTNLRAFDYGRSYDGDASRGEYAHTLQMTKFKVGSQELRLQQDQGALKWVAGLSYARDELKEDRSFLFRDSLRYVEVGSFAAYGVRKASELVATLRYDQVTRSASAFGQFDWAFAPRWNLGGSLRYTDESKTYRHGGFGFDQHSGPIAPAVAPIAGFSLEADYELQSHWSGGLSLRWQPDRQTTFYGSLQRGFKVGGFFGGFPLNGKAAILPYKEEVNDALEFGVKWAPRHGRYGANAAVFEYRYQDAQSFTTVHSELLNATITRLDNIGRAKHVGVELETFWRPFDGLRLDASAAHLDAKFLDDKSYVTNDGRLANYRGQQRTYAAKWSWVLRGQYDIALGSGANVRLALDVNGRTNANQSTGSAVDSVLLALPGYTLANARAGYQSADGRWQVAFYVRNLADKAVVISPSADGLGGFARFYGEPRTYGLDARMSF